MRSSALLVASIFALVVVADRPHAKPESRRDGRITVIVGESGESGPTPRLVVMDADGKNARVRLGWVYNASLSPNGRFVAYDEPAGRSREIGVLAADGRHRGRLLVRNGAFPDWSPTGAAIAFVRYRNGCCDGDIWIENLHSRTQRRVVRNADSPDWSPDGKKLAFVRRRSSSSASDVWAIDLASKRARRLIRGAVDPRWSPDGHRIAFERIGQVESLIYVAHADGTAARRVAEGDSAAWSPDGSEFAIADFDRVIRIRLDGTHRRVVYAPKYGCPACRDLDWVR